MSNLLTETKKILEEHGKSFDKDVEWIGCDDFSISKEQFIKYANYEYDDGYGGTEVASDLVVVGKDFWLERHEYDGSEWWEYKTIPTKLPEQEVHGIIRTQFDWYAYGGLKQMNEMEDEE